MKKGDRAVSLRNDLVAEVESRLASGLFTSCFLEYGVLNQEYSPTQHYFGCHKGSIFDVASMSKGLVLSPIVYQTAKELNLDMRGTIGDWNPGLKLSPEWQRHKILDLLAHESGLPAWLNFWVNRPITPDTNLFELASSGLSQIERVLGRAKVVLGGVGEDVYSDVGMILLGYLIQELRKESLEVSFDKLIGSKLMNLEPNCFMGGPVSHERPTRTIHPDILLPPSRQSSPRRGSRRKLFCPWRVYWACRPLCNRPEYRSFAAISGSIARIWRIFARKCQSPCKNIEDWIIRTAERR